MRPGGRTEKIRKAVLATVLRLLESGNTTFSFQDVAKDAGVHFGTIYARWPNRASLVMAAYEEHIRKLEVPFTDDWEANLYTLGTALRDFLNDPVEITTNKLLLSSEDKLFRDLMVNRFNLLAADLATPLERAKERGLVRKSADAVLVIYMLVSPIISLILYTGKVPDDNGVRSLVDHLIHSCRAHSADPSPLVSH